jgi:hypothetical protein
LQGNFLCQPASQPCFSSSNRILFFFSETYRDILGNVYRRCAHRSWVRATSAPPPPKHSIVFFLMYYYVLIIPHSVVAYDQFPRNLSLQCCLAGHF